MLWENDSNTDEEIFAMFVRPGVSFAGTVLK